MKRTRLKRNTAKAKQWLRKSTLSEAIRKLNRKKPLKKRGRKWAEHRKRDFGSKAIWISTLPCLVCNAVPSDPHHEPPRSLGGTSRDLVPLCRLHHQARHGMGSQEVFFREHGITLTSEARRFEHTWRTKEAA